jgi:hypothetical protein
MRVGNISYKTLGAGFLSSLIAELHPAMESEISNAGRVFFIICAVTALAMIAARHRGEAQRRVSCFAGKINVGKSEPRPFNHSSQFKFYLNVGNFN